MAWTYACGHAINLLLELWLLLGEADGGLVTNLSRTTDPAGEEKLTKLSGGQNAASFRYFGGHPSGVVAYR